MEHLSRFFSYIAQTQLPKLSAANGASSFVQDSINQRLKNIFKKKGVLSDLPHLHLNVTVKVVAFGVRKPYEGARKTDTSSNSHNLGIRFSGIICHLFSQIMAEIAVQSTVDSKEVLMVPVGRYSP